MPRDAAWDVLADEPCYIPGPGEGVIHFGANPSWTPDRESQSPLTCRVCGGTPAIDPRHPEWGAVPPSEYDPAEHVLTTPDDDPLNSANGFCMGCSRWKRDEWLKAKVARAALV